MITKLKKYAPMSSSPLPNWQPTSCIIFPGQLVRIRKDIFVLEDITGIIIECTYPDFSYGGADRWLVLVDGNLKTFNGFMLWPLEGEN
jgi:hypothetical protein